MALLLVTLCFAEKRDVSFLQPYQSALNTYGCVSDQDAVQAFHTSFFAFTVDLTKKAAARGNYFFTMSPHAVWITLAAIAEGADYFTQKDLFKVLHLPNDLCSRQKFYEIATTRVASNDFVNVDHARALVIDQYARLNPQWYNLIRQYSLLQVISAPLKFDPATTTQIIKQTISSDANGLDLSGNSVLLNSMDFNGLWTTAFADAVINRAPFYGETGERLGTVDLMRVKRRARIGFVPSLNAKVIELPLGVRGEYSMIFAITVNNNDASLEPVVRSFDNNTIFEIVGSLHDSFSPIDVVIPRFVINSEINMKDVLEDMGIVNLWKDIGATRYDLIYNILYLK